MRIRIIRDRDTDDLEKIEENEMNVPRECWDFHLKKNKEESEGRMKTLNDYHRKLDKLRKEEEEIKERINTLNNFKTQIEDKIKSLNQQKNGITTQELWNYCSRLSDVSKGKFHKSKK